MIYIWCKVIGSFPAACVLLGSEQTQTVRTGAKPSSGKMNKAKTRWVSGNVDININITARSLHAGNLKTVIIWFSLV